MTNRTRWFVMAATAMAMVLVGSIGIASDDVQSLKEENNALRKRVDNLEGELSQIKALLEEKGVTLPSDAATKKPPVRSGLDLELYGYIKLDAAFDDSRVNPGNFARWVESENILNDDSQFSITANQTRLGLNIDGPTVGTMTSSGKVEIDFYGGGASENKSNPKLRHAYATFGWPDSKFSVLAGQTADIISPLLCPTVNYSVALWQGNIGYRRPQLRLTKEFDLTDNTSFKLELGPTRTITDSTFVTGSIDSGADAAVPTAQGRASLSFPLFDGKKTTLGVSGHWGQEDQHMTNSMGQVSGHNHVDTWSINLDLSAPITNWLKLQAELFYGDNLYAYLGGIGQKGEIVAKGGWAAATITPCQNWQFNLGAGIDDPENDDLTAATDRSLNWMAFGNVNYLLTTNLTLAFEVMYLKTEYLGQKAGDAWREQFAVMYKF